MKESDDRYIIPNLWRALDLLEYLANEPEGKTISEIVEAMNIPTNSVFRICKTLSARGYIIQKHKRYEVSSQLFALGAKAIAEEGLFEKIYPVMRELRDETRETVILGKISAGSGVVLEQMPGLYPMKVIVEVGHRFGLHNTAPGKAILAFLPEAERKDILKGYEYTVFTPSTISSEDELLEQLETIHRTSISFDMEEADPGVRCVCSPVLNSYGYPVAALWITGPASRLSKRNLDRMADSLKKAAYGVSNSMGYFD